MGAFRDDHAPEPYAGKELRILRITGDSFSPTVRQGAFVGVDTSSVRPSSGSIFAVFVPFEGVVIKRVFCDSDTLLLRTDNPLHPSMSIPLAEAGRLIAGSLGFFRRSEPTEAGPYPLPLTERGRIFGCAARPVRAFRRNVRRTHGQDTRQASREAISLRGPASYCPEGYTPHSPSWGAEACRARKAPSYFDGKARASSAPGDTPFASILWVKCREKAFFRKRKAVFDCGTESGSIVVKYGLIIWCFR